MLEKNNQRNKKILAMYKNGNTLQAIGNGFGITRQRTQQIAFAGIKKEIAKEKGLNYQTEIENKTDKRFNGKTHKIIKFISKNREKAGIEKQRKKIRSKMKLLPHYSTFFTFKDYAAAIKICPATIKYYFPNIARKLASKKGKKDPKVKQKIKSFAHYSKFSSMNKYADAIGIDRRTIKKYYPAIAKKLFEKWKNSTHITNCRICGKKLSSYAKTCRVCLNKKTKEDIAEQMKALPHYSTFPSLQNYANAIPRTADTLKKYFPRIAKELTGKSFKKKYLRDKS